MIASASIPDTLLNDLGMGYVAISFGIIALLQHKSTADRFYREIDWDLLAFFAAPLPNLEEMALSILADDFEKNGACELIQDDVRTLQAYEVDFWDAVWKPSHHASRGEL